MEIKNLFGEVIDDVYPVLLRDEGILNQYFDYLDSLDIDRDSKENYYLVARSLARFLQKTRGNLPCPLEEVFLGDLEAEEVLSITEDEWTAYLTYYRYRKKESERTRNTRIIMLRRFCSYLAAKTGAEAPKFVMEESFSLVGPQSFINITPDLEEQIYWHLLPDNRERNMCIAALVLHCGIGLREAVALDLSDLLRDGIEVRSPGGRIRRVPFTPGLREMMNQYLEVRCPPPSHDNALFTSIHGKRLKAHSLDCIRMRTDSGQKICFRDLHVTYMWNFADTTDRQAWMEKSRSSSMRYLQHRYRRDRTGGCS